MKNFIIVIWLVFAAFFLFPTAVTYISGHPGSEVTVIIEKESEADDIQITAAEEHGIRSMYAFRAGDDFGVAVFSHFADNYNYEEGLMSNGEEHIDVNLDTGWDLYQYRVTADGAEQVGYERFGGIYRIYAVIAAVMLAFSIAAGIYGAVMKKRREEQRRKGLRQ